MPLQRVLVHVNCGVRCVRVKPFTSFNVSQGAPRCRGSSSIRSLVQHPQSLKVRRLRRVQAAEGTQEAVQASDAAAAGVAEDAPVDVVDAEVEEYEFGEDYNEKTYSDKEKALVDAAREIYNLIEDEFESEVRGIFKSELTTDESTSIFEAFGQLDSITAQLTNMTPEKLEQLLKDVSDEDIDADDDILYVDDVLSELEAEVEAELAEPEVAALEVPEAVAAEPELVAVEEPAEPEVVAAVAAEPELVAVEEPAEPEVVAAAEAEVAAVEEPAEPEEAVAEESPEPELVAAAEPEVVAAEESAEPVEVPAEPEVVAAAEPEAAAPAPEPVVVAEAAAYAPAALEVKALRQLSGAGMMDCKKALVETKGDADKALELLREKGLISAGKKSGRVAADGMITVYTHPDARFGIIMEVNCETDFVATNTKFQQLVSEMVMQCMPDPTIRYVSLEDIPEEVFAREKEIELAKPDIQSKPENIREKMVAGRVQKSLKDQCLLEMKSFYQPDLTVGQVLKEAISSLGENIKVRRFERLVRGEGVEKKESNLAAEVEAATTVPAKPKEEAPVAAPAPVEAPAAEEAPKAPAIVQVSASQVKELREATGAGMMDCKRALQQNGGDMQLATTWLRKKGLASAAKKSTRSAADGQIIGYNHPDGRFGVVMEMNCETDFVASNAKFSELGQGIIYNIAANKEVQFVSVEDIPADFIERERRIALDAPELAGKPEEVKVKIVEGKLKKVLQSLCLLYQPYVYDQKKTVEDVLKEAVVTLGENIKIRRFIRYDLGEGIEKKTADLASEVAAMTGN